MPLQTTPTRNAESPTAETYSELQAAYDFFNLELFAGELPPCLITLQREKRSYGYFSAERFQRADGTRTDEIAMNPTYFATLPLVEILQTLCHEMVHLWQHHRGNPGRARYHNLEWADKMKSIGLMPSDTGQPGGRVVGDCMADYPMAGGPFLGACEKLMTRDFQISWHDRFPSARVVLLSQQSYGLSMDLPVALLSVAGDKAAAALGVGHEEGQQGPIEALRPNKSLRDKYQCACKTNVWGKPGLKIRCEACRQLFAVVSA
ncbi:SprT-like domain-containing protein [Acidovorax sp.]|uniref:SprT-like domain-containing protein n=1 Tax=Acidovorax sp. TaxID=1872122 RepID=UPI0027B9C435|nr:SprT-like domain-containing protein [Acidovorax sp.]